MVPLVPSLQPVGVCGLTALQSPTPSHPLRYPHFHLCFCSIQAPRGYGADNKPPPVQRPAVQGRRIKTEWLFCPPCNCSWGQQ